MNSRGLGWKTGLFVLLGLVLLGTLMLQFQKGTQWFTPTYTLRLQTSDVGLIQPGAGVLMAGVPIGHVRSINLEEGGRSVTLVLEIEAKYRIYDDATFVIEQIGLLGDQFVSVIPNENEGEPLEHGDVVQGRAPFSLQAMARSTEGLVERVNQSVTHLNRAFARIDRTLLAEETLTSLSETINKLGRISQHAGSTVETIESLVQTNVESVNTTVGNTVQFSEDLSHIGGTLREVVSEHRKGIGRTLKNVERFSARADELVSRIDEGEGVAGLFMRDNETRDRLARLIANFTTLSSNLNRHGLFYKPSRTAPPETVYPGKSPFKNK